MEDIVGEIGKGFLRCIGYILAEIFFWTICYWVGWPICKILTKGKYPKSEEIIYLGESQRSGFLCAAVGLVVLLLAALYFLGVFA